MNLEKYKELAGLTEGHKKPSAGLSEKEKSEDIKKAKKGGGKNFEKIASKAAKRYGSKEAGEKVAGAVFWKKMAKEDVEYTDEEIDLLVEKWDKEYETPESKKGMFKGKDLGELESELEKLRKSGPHEKGSAEYTKEKELMFAVRAKKGWHGAEAEEETKEGLDYMRLIAGISSEPVIEEVEEDPDTYIVFESKTSPSVIGVFRTAAEAKSVLKKFKHAVGRGFKSK